MSDEWANRRLPDSILPKDEIIRRVRHMQSDKTTPWSYRRISMEAKLDVKVVQRVGYEGFMSDLTQRILSALLLDIEQGRLRVYYKNPEARRHQWGKPLQPGENTLEGRKARQHMNRIVKERSKDARIPEPERKLRIELGSGRKPLKLSTVRTQTPSADMPAFSDVVRVK